MTDATLPSEPLLLSLAGGGALSAFRRRKTLLLVQGVAPEAEDLTARYQHLVQLSAPLDPAERHILDRLLHYAPEPSPREDTGTVLLVAPRAGTLSPWSSKATDIAHSCGLDKVIRIERALRWTVRGVRGEHLHRVGALLHDRMTESVHLGHRDPVELFARHLPRPATTVAVLAGGADALAEANLALGLALSRDEIVYLERRYRRLRRDPTDAELMMFAQANSEHCRHKIFNARWRLDGADQPHSLFDMIRHTSAVSTGLARGYILTAYADNAAVIEGPEIRWLAPGPDGVYRYTPGPAGIVMKVETHNHPTAISPFAGAATGSGGEIRDEAATGRGARAKAGLVGFSVSNLHLPGYERPWESDDRPRPPHLASPLEIMLEGPVGAAGYNNEFGRPGILGYFRTYEQRLPEEGFVRGYHKPIMLAGGVGAIRREHVGKLPLPVGTRLVVIGGPAMLIGLGGGAASSLASGEGEEALDFASVQRDNAEMQRRCQEVIDACARLGPANPILSIHDVGAGGLSNAVPELVHPDGRGGRLDLRAVPSAETGMSPLEIWSNEAQERYVLGIAPRELTRFAELCARERCPFAVIGEATEEPRLTLEDPLLGGRPVDVPLDLVFGAPPRMERHAVRRARPRTRLDLDGIELAEAAQRVLRLPAVGDKTFLITIGDRTVGGLVARDQMVGRWQVPVADCAVTISDYHGYTGEVMSLGERGPLAILDPPASGRMAVAEALTNLAGAPLPGLERVVLSANWMAACGEPDEDAALFETVRSVALEVCPALDIAIPVGKDSLSMQARWHGEAGAELVRSPVSLVVSAFAPVSDVRGVLTPELDLTAGRDSVLVLVDLGAGRHRLGASALAQVYRRSGGETPDLDSPRALKGFLETVQRLNREGRLLAYHDRSDGGLLVTLCEMAFAAHAGLEVDLAPLVPGDASPEALLGALFAEELGAVVQVAIDDAGGVCAAFEAIGGLAGHVHVLGRPSRGGRLSFTHRGRPVLGAARIDYQRAWSETSHRMQFERDNSECAAEALAALLDEDDPGLTARATFSWPATPASVPRERPAVAIVREQGVNGHLEMAAAFERAGFACHDVHMSDLGRGRARLGAFSGVVACGGFSYGDVLGGGGGWAGSILFNDRARAEFETFFARPDAFALGVCNGCQMLAHLTELVPGTEGWPTFVRNRSEQFEARLVMCEVRPSPSLFLAGMAGSRLPVVVAHGEGRARFASAGALESARVCMRFVDHRGDPADSYPYNPNGSPGGITGLTNADGRVTIMMPHPERTFRTVQHSWHPREWGENGPWMQMFYNARRWVG